MSVYCILGYYVCFVLCVWLFVFEFAWILHIGHITIRVVKTACLVVFITG